MSNGTDYQTRCKGILRSAQPGWNEFKDKETGEVIRQPQFVCRFEMTDGDDAGKFETWFASLSEDENKNGKQFCEFTFESLRQCGWTGSDLAEIPSLAESGALSTEVNLVREHKQKQDKTGKWEWRSQIKYVGGGNGGAKVDLKENAMTQAELASFAKRMSRRLGGNGSSGQTQRSAAPPPARNTAPPPANRLPASNGQGDRDAPPPDDDSIPF